MSDFLLDCWYAGAWGHEIKPGSTLARQLLDMPIVFFRTESGSPVALFDRCPHRFAPLSRGKVVGEALQCGYHGLRFNNAGRCIENPHPGPIPPGAKVRSFPLIERDNILWFWPGDPQRADPTSIPSFPAHTSADYEFIWGLSSVPAHYELITDNLLDLSHVTFLHPAFGGMVFKPEFSVKQVGECIEATYFTANTPNSPFGELSIHAGGRHVDELDIMRWEMPASMRLDVWRNFTGEDPKHGAHQPSAHILTPVSQGETLYFWGSGMPAAARHDQELHRAMILQIFEQEDKPMVAAVHRSMNGHSFWDLKPMLLSVDNASVRARRLLREKIAGQGGATSQGQVGEN